MSEVTRKRKQLVQDFDQTVFNLKESIMGETGNGKGTKTIADTYGENVFSLKVMREHLSEKAFQSISTTIKEDGKLDPSIADEVAEAMKNWAIAKGATHFTHWFQPLTGTTAEKHDAFISPDGEALNGRMQGTRISDPEVAVIDYAVERLTVPITHLFALIR